MDVLARLESAVAGRYAIEGELGQGGMANVYLATDLKHGRRVAVKVLKPDLASDVAAERFLREIGIEARLQHPNILPLHDSGGAEGFLYYIMPYVEGESLRDRLDREGELPLDEALAIIREIADGLEYAHQHGVVHRDIKPENILLSAGHATISDFGIARAISEAGGERVTKPGHAVGTPAYMSPEQGGGETEIDRRSDVYSLGCVLYEMLAGEPPFTGPTPRAVIARHMLEKPPSLEVVRPSVPDPVCRAIEKALAKSRADRFATASEFVTALDAPALAADAESPDVAPPEPSPPVPDRYRFTLVLRVLLIYLAVAAGLLEVVDILIDRLDLSEWLFAGAVLFFLAGFPIAIGLAVWHGSRRMMRTVRAPGRSVFGWGYVGLTGFSAVVSWGLALALWPHVRPPPPPLLDANHIVVFPLVEQGLGSAPPGSGERVALRVGSALEQTEPLRFLWGWKWLTPRERNDVRLLSAEAADSITRSRGARYYIDGSVVGNPGALSVTLRLYDVAADSLVWQRTAHGGPSPDSLNLLGLDAMSHLLPALLTPGVEVDPATYEGRDLAAEALWMQGEQLYRRGQYSPAYEMYRRAIELDSTLSMAALRGAQAANWKNMDPEATDLVQLALGHVETLPRRYSDYASGLLSYLQGHADSAVAQLRRALAADPEWSEVWTILGETYYHFLPGEGPRDSLAEAAFLAARLHDPEFTLPLFHLSEFAIWSGDLDQARERVQAFAASDADSGKVRHLTLMLECAEGGLQGDRWREAAEGNPSAVLQASASFTRAGVYPRCAEQGFRAYISAGTGTEVGGWDAMVGLTSLLAAEGRAEAAAPVLDSAVAAGFSTANYLHVYIAGAGGGLEQQARSFIDSLVAEPAAERELNLWARGVWAVHTGDAVEIERIAEELVRRSAEPNAYPRTRVFAEIMDVHATLLAGDSTVALDKLERLRPRGLRGWIYWSLWYGIGFERLLLAELLLARGDYERAYRIGEEFDRSAPVPYQALLPRSLVLRERAARALGRTDLVTRTRDRLAELGRSDLLELQH